MSNKAIEIKNLSYAYPDGTGALFEVNLELAKGESLGLIGPNGAGKSTLLLHLNGMLRNGSQVKILGSEIREDNLEFIRSKVGLVFQDPDSQLFMPTVFDDVGFGPINMRKKEAEVRSSVNSALEEVDMLDKIEKSSHHLSFGEKKRVSIATILSMAPEILVLDEPSSNLDGRHRRELIALLKKLSFTKVIATHDLDLVSRACSQVALLNKGRVEACGKASDILSNKALLEAHGL